MNNCHYCNDKDCPELDWVYGLDDILPDYKFCPMCGRRVDGDGNDPLTPEELREMDGEPVWCEMFIKGARPFYGIVHGDSITGYAPSDDRPISNEVSAIGAYGLAWVAYRRKPEGGDINA